MSDLTDLVGESVLDDESFNQATSQPLTEDELIQLDSLLLRLNHSKQQIISKSKHPSTVQPTDDSSNHSTDQQTDQSVKAKSIRCSIVDIARSIDASQLTLLGLNKEGFSRKQMLKKNQSLEQSKKSMKKAADRKYIESVNLRSARNAALHAMMEDHAQGNLTDQQLIEQQAQLMIEDSADKSVDQSGGPSIDQSSNHRMLSDEAASTNHSSFHARTIMSLSPSTEKTVAQAIEPSASHSTDQSTVVAVDQSTQQSTDQPVKLSRKQRQKVGQAGEFVDPPKSKVIVEDEEELNKRTSKQSTDQSTPDQPVDDDADFGPELSYARSCYSCKTRFFRLHRFYDQFCADCARLNWQKRKQLADLSDWCVLLTGCRVKIGFCIGLRILRSGGRLIGTSRFPIDTTRRYLAEKDSDQWSDRLHIYGLDLRDLQATHSFCSMLMEKHPRIDALINNAAQTVRRPVAYYRHLMPVESTERSMMPEKWKSIVQLDDSHQSRIAAIRAKNAISDESIDQSANSSADLPSNQSANGEINQSSESSVTSTTQIPHSTSALLSQLALTTEDKQSINQSHFFPQGKFDVTGQQLDLRPINSWILTLDQVSPVELVEVFAINALSPFLLCAGLRKALANRPINQPTDQSTKTSNVPHYAHIINVSAMEGKFYRFKSPFHPHTNMAKAALNMMTRTSAQDYAQQRIWMNAADTGWINDENTFEKAQAIREMNNFQTPIDEEDAAARVLDPIMQSAIHGVHHYGKFFKDYRETEW